MKYMKLLSKYSVYIVLLCGTLGYIFSIESLQNIFLFFGLLLLPLSNTFLFLLFAALYFFVPKQEVLKNLPPTIHSVSDVFTPTLFAVQLVYITTLVVYGYFFIPFMCLVFLAFSWAMCQDIFSKENEEENIEEPLDNSP